jgi:hypothetical protein
LKKNIQMVDLKSQYKKIKDQIDTAVIQTIESTSFINGPVVKEFANSLEKYLDAKHVIPCANGTDALQIALMALSLKPGDEVICPSFTYVATAKVISLLGLTPVMTNVDPDTFNITADIIRPHITSKTKAIVPVHLYGQSSDMEGIMDLAKEFGLYVIEDNAQAIGAKYTFSDGTVKKNVVHVQSHDRSSGYLEFERARVRWFLSINFDVLPDDIKLSGQRTYRSITIEGEELEFSGGFTDLHTKVYEGVLNGNGYGLEDARQSIEIVHEIRNTEPIGLKGDYHPFAKKSLSPHPFVSKNILK